MTLLNIDSLSNANVSKRLLRGRVLLLLKQKEDGDRIRGFCMIERGREESLAACVGGFRPDV